jgi:glycine betaine/proline transport system ATP-binding protein
VNWESDLTTLDDIGESTVVQANPDISMREAIELKQRSNQPILLVEENKLVGVLSDNELYDALLGNFKSKQVA